MKYVQTVPSCWDNLRTSLVIVNHYMLLIVPEMCLKQYCWPMLIRQSLVVRMSTLDKPLPVVSSQFLSLGLMASSVAYIFLKCTCTVVWMKHIQFSGLSILLIHRGIASGVAHVSVVDKFAYRNPRRQQLLSSLWYGVND